jgi:hypothetical protein
LQSKTSICLGVPLSDDLIDRIDHHLPGYRIDRGLPDRNSKPRLGYDTHTFTGLKNDATTPIPGDSCKDSRPMCLIRIVAGILDHNDFHRTVLLHGDPINRDAETMESAWKKNVYLRRVLVTQQFQQRSFHGGSRTRAGGKASLQAILRGLGEIKGYRERTWFVLCHLL